MRAAWLVLAAPLLLAAGPDPTPAPTASPAPPPAAPAPPAASAPPVPITVQPVSPEQAVAILGRSVQGPAGSDIGRLVDVLVDARGQPQAAVIDFGGFMGLGDRMIAVHWSALHFTPSDADHPIRLDLTPDELKAAPAYTDPSKPAPVVTPAKKP